MQPGNETAYLSTCRFKTPVWFVTVHTYDMHWITDIINPKEVGQPRRHLQTHNTSMHSSEIYNNDSTSQTTGVAQRRNCPGLHVISNSVRRNAGYKVFVFQKKQNDVVSFRYQSCGLLIKIMLQVCCFI